MYITKVVKVLEIIEEKEDQIDFVEAINKVINYVISKAKTNHIFITNTFHDEIFLKEMLRIDDVNLHKAVVDINRISTRLIGEDIYTLDNPYDFALELFAGFYNKN